MRSIAKWLVLRHSAAAKRNNGSAAKAIYIPFGVVDAEFAFDPNWAIVDDGDFHGHAAPILTEEA